MMEKKEAKIATLLLGGWMMLIGFFVLGVAILTDSLVVTGIISIVFVIIFPFDRVTIWALRKLELTKVEKIIYGECST